MPARDRLRPPRQVVVAFTAVVVVSTGALAVLSWQLLAQDRQLDEPRRRGLLERAADDAVKAMQSSVDRLAALAIDESSTSGMNDVSTLSIALDDTIVRSGSDLPFVPTRPVFPEADPTVFLSANALEQGDAEGAQAAYKQLAKHKDPAVRAAALTQLAAVQLRRGDLVAALGTYDALDATPNVGVGGLPSGLVASAGRANALAARGGADRLHEAATALATDLARRRWPLLQSEYDFYAAQAATWSGAAAGVPTDALARADAATWLWRERTSLPSSGRRIVLQPRGAAVIAWRASGDRMNAAIGGPLFLSRMISDSVRPGMVPSLRDLEGRYVHGEAPSVGEVATRIAASASVPWTLQLVADPRAVIARDGSQRQLLLRIVGVTTLVLCAGWYFIARALQREVRVARLQGDFVAAVSHEFRSPLTSLAHVAELLSGDRLPTDAHRRQAYEVLVVDTTRLRDLVEHLLDVSRFEAGAPAMRFDRVDVVALVGEIVEEARRRVAAQGYAIAFSPPPEPLLADVDKDAFGRAIWNLIDNAVKYSPDCRTVWVDITREGDRVAVAIRDEGLGIPRDEQTEVFERFVRGAESKARRIRGTGIGLALVRQIVNAHGGEIRLASTPGQGSRFVVVLRAAEGAV